MKPQNSLFILAVLILLVVAGCSAPTSKLVKECTQLCFENGGSISQGLKDSCQSSCSQVEYYGGEKAIKDTIEEFKSSIKFNQDLENGVYDEDINQCASWKIDLITAQNDHYKFIGNFDKAHQKETNLQKERETCKQIVENWVLKENKQKPLGIEFKEEADSIKSKEEKVTEECYPTIFEYKTLVYTKRNELDQHDIEKETISDCLGKVDSPDFEEYINTIKADIPNWK
jgi:hypothetical protein